MIQRCALLRILRGAQDSFAVKPREYEVFIRQLGYFSINFPNSRKFAVCFHLQPLHLRDCRQNHTRPQVANLIHHGNKGFKQLCLRNSRCVTQVGVQLMSKAPPVLFAVDTDRCISRTALAADFLAQHIFCLLASAARPPMNDSLNCLKVFFCNDRQIHIFNVILRFFSSVLFPRKWQCVCGIALLQQGITDIPLICQNIVDRIDPPSIRGKALGRIARVQRICDVLFPDS